MSPRTGLAGARLLTTEHPFSQNATRPPGIEAKRGLPDTNPASYRDVKPLLDISRRELVYLVRTGYAETVRELVGPETDGYGILTWPDLVELQVELASRHLPDHASEMVGSILIHLASTLEIERFADRRSEVHSPDAIEAIVSSNRGWPEHLRQWLRGAACFLRAQSGTVPSAPPFDYLRSEPSFREIHELPRRDAQDVKEHGVELWRIPRPAL